LIWAPGTDRIQTERPTVDSGKAFVVRVVVLVKERNIWGKEKSRSEASPEDTVRRHAVEGDVGRGYLAESEDSGCE